MNILALITNFVPFLVFLLSFFSNFDLLVWKKCEQCMVYIRYGVVSRDVGN